MADIAHAAPARPLPQVYRWLRGNLFSTPLSTALTLLVLYVLIKIVPPLVDWAVVNASLTAPNEQACAVRGGACWAFITKWYRFILFGRYPHDEQWRPAVVVLLLIMLLVASCDRRLWGRALALLWAAGVAAVAWLMAGGVLGLPWVDTDLWNGLPLALILLFLPPGVSIAKLWRVEVAFILFLAAYLAEVVRGGLQAIPRGQYEAAAALGLGYWRQMRLVILPQALRIAIPPLVGTFIGGFKDTALVSIVGLFDLLQDVAVGTNDPSWRGAYIEGYTFVAAIYFVFCYAMSRYSRSLEARRRRIRATTQKSLRAIAR